MSTPLGALARGMAAGVIGTALMTGYQELVARIRSGGDDEDQGHDAANGGPADP